MSESAETVKQSVLEEAGKQISGSTELDSKGVARIIWQENAAEIIHEETPVQFTGVISSPLDWIKKRIDLIDQKASYIIVTPDSYSIELITEERDFFKNKINGKMELDDTFKLFKINTNEFKSAKEWAALFKKHKYAFETLNDANKLILNLLNFKAKISEGIEQGRDNRGNIKDNYEREVIENNLPEKFAIKLPIFKGMAAKDIDVEFEVADGDLSLSLWSDYVQVEVIKTRDDSLSDIIDQILAIAPNIVVFYK